MEYKQLIWFSLRLTGFIMYKPVEEGRLWTFFSISKRTINFVRYMRQFIMWFKTLLWLFCRVWLPRSMEYCQSSLCKQYKKWIIKPINKNSMIQIEIETLVGVPYFWSRNGCIESCESGCKEESLLLSWGLRAVVSLLFIKYSRIAG